MGEGLVCKLAKPKAKRMRLLEALESSSEEEAVPAAPMRVQTGKRSKPKKEKSSKEESEKVKGRESNSKEVEAVTREEQPMQVEKEHMEKTDEAGKVRPGPKLTPEVAAKWRAVGATAPNASKLQGVSGGQKSVGDSADGPKLQGVLGGQKPMATSAKALSTIDGISGDGLSCVSTKAPSVPPVSSVSEN